MPPLLTPVACACLALVLATPAQSQAPALLSSALARPDTDAPAGVSLDGYGLGVVAAGGNTPFGQAGAGLRVELGGWAYADLGLGRSLSGLHAGATAGARLQRWVWSTLGLSLGVELSVSGGRYQRFALGMRPLVTARDARWLHARLSLEGRHPNGGFVRAAAGYAQTVREWGCHDGRREGGRCQGRLRAPAFGVSAGFSWLR